MRIDKSLLEKLSDLDLDHVEVHGASCTTPDCTFYLYRDRKMGVFIEEAGLVLQPVHSEVLRLGDIVLVIEPDKKDNHNHFGIYSGYHIHLKTWVLPQMYHRHEFWNELERYNKIAWRPSS